MLEISFSLLGGCLVAGCSWWQRTDTGKLSCVILRFRPRDPEGIGVCPVSSGHKAAFLWHMAVLPEARKQGGLAGTAGRLQRNNRISHSPTPLTQ